MAKTLEVQREDEQLFGRDWYDLDCYATEILDAKYEKDNTNEVFDQLIHLNGAQKEDLHKVLKDFPKLFDGTLGVYPHRKFHMTFCQTQNQSTSGHMP